MKTSGFLEHGHIDCYLSHTFIEITALYFLCSNSCRAGCLQDFPVSENPECVNLDIRMITVLIPVVWVRNKHFASFINKYGKDPWFLFLGM